MSAHPAVYLQSPGEITEQSESWTVPEHRSVQVHPLLPLQSRSKLCDEHGAALLPLDTVPEQVLVSSQPCCKMHWSPVSI
jgi:hypothetical protein